MTLETSGIASGVCGKGLKLAFRSFLMKEVTIRDIFGGGEGHEFLKKA